MVYNQSSCTYAEYNSLNGETNRPVVLVLADIRNCVIYISFAVTLRNYEVTIQIDVARLLL